MPDNYYYLNDQNKAVGPFSLEDLNHQQENGLISQDTLACEEGGDDWIPVSELLSKMSETSEETQVFYYLNESNTAVGPFSLDDLTRQCDARVIEPNTLVCEGGSDKWKPLAEFISQGQPTGKGGQVDNEEADTAIPSGTPTGEKPKKFVSASLWQKVKVATIAGTVGWILIWSSIGLSPVISENGAIAVYFLGWTTFLAMSVLHAVVYMRCWNNLPDRHRLMSPRMAVYPLAIPLWHLYWIFVCLRRLVKSLAAWEDEAGINPQPVLLNRATILACLLSADLFFLILGVPTVVAFPVYCGAMVATNCLGYIVFKHLVCRINQLRGTPEDALMEKTDEDGSGKVLPFGRLHWAAISLGAVSGVTHLVVVTGAIVPREASVRFMSDGAAVEVQKVIEDINDGRRANQYTKLATNYYDTARKRYEAQVRFDRITDPREYEVSFARASRVMPSMKEDLDMSMEAKQTKYDSAKADLEQANAEYARAQREFLLFGGEYPDAATQQQRQKMKEWEDQVANANVQALGRLMDELQAEGQRDQQLRNSAMYELKQITIYEREIEMRLQNRHSINSNVADMLQLELEQCRQRKWKLLNQVYGGALEDL